ncbi:response regulator transcription factor [Sulfurimonas sp. SAG-AH-194-C20]|nr:response regulator transcription factor [Sulfurimonas sp. SAG-AH-194-C20]MDF1878920.1 response regulator transcription factor [Sulfurimonas sp. SAG-AH-194-C20]
MKHKILIVEDEPDIVNLISNRLDKEKYDVTVALTGDKALLLVQTQKFDLVSLDLMLPEVDGLTVCQELRKKNKKILVIILSALDLTQTKEKAYKLGADDYITKPFSPKLLVLKIESLLQRRFELLNPDMQFQKFIQQSKDLQKFFIDKKDLALTPSEYLIFETLFNNPKKVFSKDTLSQILYNEDLGNIDKDGIRTHIYTLRKKIADLTDVEIIKTIRGTGFTLYEN